MLDDDIDALGEPTQSRSVLHAKAEAALTARRRGRSRTELALPRVPSHLLGRPSTRTSVEHLTNMDHLRDGIGLRGYGQRDPKNEYKKEGYKPLPQHDGSRLEKRAW